MTTPVRPAFQSVLIVFNPKSGNGESGIETFAQYLRDAHVRVVMRETQPGVSCDEYLTDLSQYDALVAGGGDGTVSSVAYAARDQGKPFMPYPAGTANLIAQNLNLPKEPRALADLFLRGPVLPLDLAEIEIAGEVYGVAMLAGLGADAAMIRDSEDMKGNMGVAAYVVSAMKQLNPRRTTFKLTLDGRTTEAEGMGVMVANFGMANFRLPITGDVDPADGKLTVIVLKGGSIASLLPHLIGSVRAKLNLGDPNLGNSIDTYEASEVHVEAADDLPAQYDGETLKENARAFHARVLPKGVRYITDATMEDLTT